VVDCARDNALLAEMDAASAPLLLHEGAVYLHQGQTWIIERTDWEAGIAYARGADIDYYTEAAVENRIEVVSVEQTARLNGGAGSGGADTGGAPERGFGEASVTSRVTRYRRIRFETQETLGHGEVSAPESAMRTEAAWWRFAPETEGKMRSAGLSLEAGLRGLAWLVGNLAPVFVLCDRSDFRVTALMDWGLRNADGGLGGSGSGGAGSGPGIGDRGLERENAREQRTGPVMYLFDLYPGGIGIARHVFERDAELRKAALELLRSCPCAHGCPSCIGPGYGGEAKSSVEYLLRNAEGWGAS
jgi:DEAD/DEAH box helicase domain-containing protein